MSAISMEVAAAEESGPAVTITPPASGPTAVNVAAAAAVAGGTVVVPQDDDGDFYQVSASTLSVGSERNVPCRCCIRKSVLRILCEMPARGRYSSGETSMQGTAE